MVSAIYILNGPLVDTQILHFELLLHRGYHNDVPDESFILSDFDAAYKRLKPEERCPFIFSNGISYTYIQCDNNIFIMAVSRSNINVMSIITFLHNFYRILFQYLCVKPKNLTEFSNKEEQILNTILRLDKDRIIDNFVIIYELLDECMDFGVAQLTDYNILKEYIKVETNWAKSTSQILDDGNEYELSDSKSDDEFNEKYKRDKKKNSKAHQKKLKNIKSTHNQAIKTDVLESIDTKINSSILRTAALNISWRPKGIFYAKNEIYIDIIENCEFYYDLETEIIKINEVHGTCVVKSLLSGMPTCKLGFNEHNISRIGNDETYDEENEVHDSNSKREDNQLKVEPDEEEEDEQQEELLSEKTKKQRRRIPIRNVQFHQCIELGSIYKDNLICFIPPDDNFTLLTYQVEQEKQRRKLPLIMIKPTYRIHRITKKLQVLCVLSTNFKKKLHCNNLQIRLPINPSLFPIKYDNRNQTDDLKYKSELGDVSYKVDASELIWNIDQVNGARKSIKMMAELSLNEINHLESLTTIDKSLLSNLMQPDSNDKDSDPEEYDTKKELDQYYGVNGVSSSLFDKLQKKLKRKKDHNHVSLRFSIPMLAYSGLKLNYLRVDEESMKYSCFPWVRYVTQSESNFGLDSKVDEISRNDKSCNYRFKLGSNCFQLF